MRPVLTSGRPARIPRGRRAATASGERAHAAARASSSSERSYRACGRTCGYRRGTVSRLWFSTSGRAASTAPSAASSPPRSGMSTSTVASGTASRTATTAAANCAAPPSGRSSRVTLVIDHVPQSQTPRRLGDPARLVLVQRAHSAARASRLPHAGLPSPSTAQNVHARVHTSPRIRKVAVPAA